MYSVWELAPLVVALLVAFFGLLLAGHGFAARHEPGMSTFAFAPLGVAGMTLAGVLYGFSPIPQLATTLIAIGAAPLSFTGFALDAWRDARNAHRVRWVWVSVVAVALVWATLELLGVGDFVSVPGPMLALRVAAFGLPCFVFASHASMRGDGSASERRTSFRTVLAIGSSLGTAMLFSLPTLLRTPWNIADPVLWVALAALCCMWVQSLEGRVAMRLFASRALTWLVLFLGLVALAAVAARQLEVGLDLPRVLTGVVATLLIGVGFVVVSEAVSRRVDALIGPRLERDLEQARRTVQSMQDKWDHLERLALAGELAALVAHEIKNPLQAVRGYAELLADLKEKLPLEDQARFEKSLQIIKDESDRINARVQSLLQLSRPAAMANDERTPFSLRRVATEAVAMMEPQARPVVISLQAEEALEARGNADGLRSALVNLLRNARDAQATGTIAVSLSKTEGRARLMVADEGHGLSDEHLASPVVAFRSTRPDGTGLGLVIAQAGIAACGGTLTFERNAPRGTRAVIDLPLSEGLDTHG